MEISGEFNINIKNNMEMKNIIDYKIFETKTQMDIAEDAVQKLKDNLIYLNDEGFDVKVGMDMKAKATIFISIIVDTNKKTARWSDIKDDVEPAIESVDYKFYPSQVYYKFEEDDFDYISYKAFINKDWKLRSNNRYLTYLLIELSEK